MIRPTKMKKLSAVVLEDKRDAVLRELKEMGVIHLLKVEEGDISDIELSPGRTVGVNVKASEYLSKMEGMLDVFALAKGEDVSLVKKLTQEPVAPVVTEELPPSELFKNVEEKLSSLEDRVFGISSRLEEFKKETEEVLNAKDIISKLKFLELGPADIEDFESTFIAPGTIMTAEIPAFRDEISEVTDLFSIHSVEFNKTDSIVLLIALKEFEADVRRTMHIHRFEEFHVPANFSHLTLQEAGSEMEAKLSQITEEEEKLLSEVKEIKDAEEHGLLLMRESLQVEKLLDETNIFFGNTASTFLLRGWVPVDMADGVVEVIERASDNHCITLVEDPTKEEEHHVPTLLDNLPVAKPLEMLTNTYGIPSYGKIDPSLLMSISFPIIFGLMFGDVGQGLVLVALGYIIGFHLKLDESPRRLGRILLLCGICATLTGFLYGEVFGLELMHPLWVHPLESTMTLVVFSFYIALAQLSLGCFVNIADELSHGKPLHAIFSPWGVMGLWLFWGGATLLMRLELDGMFDVLFGLFSGALFVSSVKTLALPLFFPIAMIAVGGKYVEGLAISWSIYEAYEACTRFLFNSISYVRVGALAIVHAVFARVMLMGVDASPHIVLTVLILIGGNIFIIAFETLISFIQTLRLHYYEWFSKFYEGAGTDFEAFKVMRKYTFLAPLSGR